MIKNNRRDLLLVAASLPLLGLPARAADLKGDELPLVTTGLEHFGMTVPDLVATTRFYCAVFGFGLFKEKDPPLRYYVMLGNGYMAIGTRENLPKPILDHYCVLVENFDRDLMNADMVKAGLPTGQRGMYPDPDKLAFQILKAPGGPTDTYVPADKLLLKGYNLVQPVGMDHVLLRVTDPERSAKFYDRFLLRTPARESGEIWFKAADTTIRLAKVADGQAPAFSRWGVRVGPYDVDGVKKGLTGLGATLRDGGGKGHLRFDDPNGLSVELITI